MHTKFEFHTRNKYVRNLLSNGMKMTKEDLKICDFSYLRNKGTKDGNHIFRIIYAQRIIHIFHIK